MRKTEHRIMAWSTGAVVVTTIAVILAHCLTGTSADNKLKEIFKWKQMDFAYKSEALRNEAIQQRKFVALNNLPLGIEVWKDKVFITVPRWKSSGVPASLNYVNLTEGEESPRLVPYPDWETHDITSGPYENKIINPFRVRADECDRLWVMDTGVNGILESAESLSPPKIMVFDLKNNSLLRVFPFPTSHLKEDSFFANIIVDLDKTKCDEAFAYVPDLGSYALIVYDWATNETWRVKHHYFYLDPLSGDYNVGGFNFQWTDGLFSVAMGHRGVDGNRTLYFHPLSSTREFTVSNRVIQNKTIASDSYHDFKVLGSRGPNTQATASFMDPETGILFYTQINRNGIGCWNSKNDYSADTNALLASDNQTMIFPNDLKIDRNGNVWFTTDRLPAFIYNQMNVDDVNYRIFTGSVKDLVKGTVCEN